MRTFHADVFQHRAVPRFRIQHEFVALALATGRGECDFAGRFDGGDGIVAGTASGEVELLASERQHLGPVGKNCKARPATRHPDNDFNAIVGTGRSRQRFLWGRDEIGRLQFGYGGKLRGVFQAR